ESSADHKVPRPPAPGDSGLRPAAVEKAAMSGAGSVLQQAGIIDPSVPIRDIQTKFAVLSGLIQAGEVSNRDIVETVLNLVSKLLFTLCKCPSSVD
uniref:Uncharacterized protein n=1 Tax=Hippocampus comes TaxID=109280 RepID=A0A3Q2YVZ1_HIPCM